MSKSWTRVVSGRMVYEIVASVPLASDPPKIRAQKEKASSEARQRINFRTSYQKLERILAGNFDDGDIRVELTFDDKHLPDSRKKVISRMRCFLKKLRAARKARGQPLSYVYVVEGFCPGGRPHVHIVLNSTGDDLEEIRRLWSYGTDINLKVLTFDRTYTYEDLASYLTKEPRDWGSPKLGERMWVQSLGLNMPEKESARVPDSMTLEPPPEALTFCKEGPVVNGYGSWCWIKYLLPRDPSRKRKGTRRRKRKKE